MPAGREPREPARRSRGRRLALGAVALAALVALVALVWPRSGAEGPARETAPVSAPAPPVSSGGAAAEALPESVQRYLASSVYPPTSGRLTEGDVDLLHPNRRYEEPRPVFATLGGDPGDVVRTLLTADRYHLEAGDTARATLQAWRGDAPIPGELRVEEATLTAEGCAGEDEGSVPVHFGRRGDGHEADLPFEELGGHHGAVLLVVRFRVGDVAEVQRDELRFFHTPSDEIPAQLLPGRFGDAVHEGSLRLELGVDVRDPGFYRFDANLVALDGRPVAFAAFKGKLGKGVRTVPLVIYGKVLRDAGIPGPWRVTGVRGYRFRDGKCPDRENVPALPGQYTTAAHPLSAFTDEPHTSAHKEQMIELLLEDERRGIGPEYPELPHADGPDTAPAGPDDVYEPPPPGAGTPHAG